MNLEQRTVKELKVSQKESFATKKGDLESVKGLLEERFDKLPKDLVLEMINIRRAIEDVIKEENFVDELDEKIDNRIKLLVAKIYNPEFKNEEIEGITENDNGDIEVSLINGEKVSLGEYEKELLFSMRLYFDSFRLAQNANKFRSNVAEVRAGIVKDNKDRKLNFYSEDEKKEEVIARLQERYAQVGFSNAEISELTETCDLKQLENLPIHQIKMMRKIADIFSRFMSGDKTKYIGLSAALMVPAFIEGYAPMLFSDAFKDNTININQIILYTMASAGGGGLSALIQKHYKDFTNTNYQKEGGIGEFAARNLVEMPPDETKKFGADTVKHRASLGRFSYEEILRSFGFDILPAVTTLTTSAVMLYEKSPILAGGTALASGITIVLDKYFQKVGKFWEKERDAERTSEQMAQKLNEELSAHMEVVLAGEKERFFNEVREFIEQESIAETNRNFFEVLETTYSRFTGAINFTLAGVASLLAGGTVDKAIAAIMYSGNFTNGVNDLLKNKRHLLKNLRNIMQMELMFNGHANKEEGKENSRVSVDQIKDGRIVLKGVNVEMEGKKILNDVNLDIPSGSMVYLEGASGAGKTTLMKVIAGYYRPSSGEVKFGGVEVGDIKKTGDKSIYTRIAYFSQFPYLFQDSLRNNLTFGLNQPIGDEKIKEVLKDVGLDNRFVDLNEGLLSGSGDVGKTSGGETSRVGLARVLLKIRNSDCRLVFLDEPTASVDEPTKKDIARIINAEKAKRPETTFIVISHDESFMGMLNCDIKKKIEKGRMIED